MSLMTLFFAVTVYTHGTIPAENGAFPTDIMERLHKDIQATLDNN